MANSTTSTVRPQQIQNVASAERLAFTVAGGTLVAYGLSQRSWNGVGLAALGGVLIYRGATGPRNVYQMLGIDTSRQAPNWRNDGALYELGIRVDRAVTINKSREAVYQFFRNFENLPRFMRHLECVKEIDNKHSYWVAKAPVGRSVEWKAEIIN
jgi:uncharacterized membrane protein